MAAAMVKKKKKLLLFCPLFFSIRSNFVVGYYTKCPILSPFLEGGGGRRSLLSFPPSTAFHTKQTKTCYLFVHLFLPSCASSSPINGCLAGFSPSPSPSPVRLETNKQTNKQRQRRLLLLTLCGNYNRYM